MAENIEEKYVLGPLRDEESIEGITVISDTSTKAFVTATENLGEKANEDLVDFSSEDDPSNPVNWSLRYKWSLIAIISMMEFVTTLATVIAAPVAPQILTEFKSDSQLYSTLLVSIWELGEVLGPLVIAPLSELYGRFYIYHTCNISFIIFSIAGALSTNIHMLIAFRFLNGLAVAAVTLNPSITGDLFKTEERGSAMALVNLAPMIGPVVGPIVGSYLGNAAGWRWNFWLVAILCGVLETLFFILYCETYKVRILDQKAKRLRIETGHNKFRSKYTTGASTSQVIKDAVRRPLSLLLLSPTVFLLSLYVSVVYGYLYLIMTTITEVFESVYHFSEGPVGLVFLGLGVGMILGVALCHSTLDLWVRRSSASGLMTPEQRLPPVVFGGLILPIGLFMYGWTTEAHVQWIAPIIATGILGLGLIATMIPTANYLVDAFGIHAASAIAAMVVLRNITGAILPLAGPPLYSALGLGWGNSVLGFIALAFIPVPLLLMRYGARLRLWGRRIIEE